MVIGGAVRGYSETLMGLIHQMMRIDPQCYSCIKNDDVCERNTMEFGQAISQVVKSVRMSVMVLVGGYL